MAQGPDGGRSEGDARRVDWDALQPAVRRADGGDPVNGGDSAAPDADADSDDDATDADDESGIQPADPGGDQPANPDGDQPANPDGDQPAGVGDSQPTHPTGDGRLDDWRDLEPAITPADGGGEDGGGGEGGAGEEGGPERDWDHRDLTPPDLKDEESSPATNPEVLAEQSREDVVGPDPAPAPASGGLGMDAPETDEEAPLAVHVEEMVKRLGIVIAVAGLVSVVVFPLTESLITTIWNNVLPGAEAVDPRVYHPLELVITQIKVASLAGLVVALPVFVYESYLFMRPGLYEHERRYYLAAIPTSLVLAVVGVLFAYEIVLPITMDYFQGYTQGTAEVAFALGSTFNLILMVMGYLAVVFQIPLFIMLAIMLGVVTRQWLEDRRLLFWAAFAGISFTFGAIDPTGVVPIIVAITMIALFEGTLALLRWTGN